MPATEIPPERPLAAPPRLERSDLYNPEHWETAYREVHNVPELLIQLQDDLSRSRKREAFWISVIVHLVIIILLWNSDKFARFFPMHQVKIRQAAWMNDKELSFLVQPPDRQRVTKRPNTNIISDKDRTAMSRTHLDPKELQKILDSSRAGAPGQSAPPIQQQPQAQAQAAQPELPKTPPADNQSASLHMPQSTAPKPSFDARSLSAGSAVEEAARAALSHPGQYGGGGDYGLGQGRQRTGAIGPMEVLNDTMGVDFGPYLQRVLQDVRTNWYNLIPESARAPLMKKGKVSIEFAILKNGQVASMILAGPSGDVALDRAAWGGITQSSPFPPLPAEFRGDYLALRFHFYYNPDKGDIE